MISNAEITHGPKIIPLWSEPDGWTFQTAPGRSRGLQSLEIRRIIAVRDVVRRPLAWWDFASCSAIAFYRRWDGSELYLCPTNCRLSDKGARPAGLKLRLWLSKVRSRHSKNKMDRFTAPCLGWNQILTERYSNRVCIIRVTVARGEAECKTSAADETI